MKNIMLEERRPLCSQSTECRYIRQRDMAWARVMRAVREGLLVGVRRSWREVGLVLWGVGLVGLGWWEEGSPMGSWKGGGLGA